MNYDELLFLANNIKILDVQRMDGTKLTSKENLSKLFVLTRIPDRSIKSFRSMNSLAIVLGIINELQ